MPVPNNKEIWQRIRQSPFLVAEIGKNFIQSREKKSSREYLENAKRLISEAKKAGATAAKFQTHNVEDEQMKINVASPHFPLQERYNWVKFNTKITPLKFWQELKRYCDKLGIIFFSTPMSRGAAMKLEKTGIRLWKVGSGDILDFVMLDYLAKTRKPIIISSGMSTLEEIDKAVNFLKKRTDKIVLLHCVSLYPCPEENLNLKTIEFFKKRYGVLVGFSDHSISQESALSAVALGAQVIEKHFSLKRNLWGPDHKISMTPLEFRVLAQKLKARSQIRLTNLGKKAKILQEGEISFRPIFRKSLVSASNLKKGTVLRPELVYAMRPQAYINGLPSEEYEKVLARKIKKSLKKYEPITKENLE